MRISDWSSDVCSSYLAVLLDNMTPQEAKAAVDLATAWAAEHGRPRPLLECSGGTSIDTAADYSASGVDLLSTSQLPQSAPALDTIGRASCREREGQYGKI